MYTTHFSFKYKPFELVPNPDFLYRSGTHKKAITYLDYGIKSGIGFILLTGEIGSGKTTIVRNLIKNLDGTVKLSKINNTKLSSEQLLSMINEDFGLDVEGKSKRRLLSDLNQFLIQQYAQKCQPVLLIDEAQNLSPDLLEEIRLLSNLETDKAKLLQIILVGQPELKETIQLPNLVQLRQRITLNYHITALSMHETAEYIKHRLTIAGNPGVINFEEDMLDIIYRFSRGIPRLINILCDFVLLSTYVEGRSTVSVDTVREVARDLEFHDYRNGAGAAASMSQDTLAASDGSRETPFVMTNERDQDMLPPAVEVTQRLIELEEAVSQVIKDRLREISLLCGKTAGLHKDISEAISDRDNSRLNGLLNKISALEQICRSYGYQKKDEEADVEKEIPVKEP